MRKSRIICSYHCDPRMHETRHVEALSDKVMILHGVTDTRSQSGTSRSILTRAKRPQGMHMNAATCHSWFALHVGNKSCLYEFTELNFLSVGSPRTLNTLID